MTRVLAWDWRQQIDLDDLADAIRDVSGGRLQLTQVDTGSDQYAVALSAEDAAGPTTDVDRIRIDTMRRLADHFDALRRIGGSPQLDNTMWHAAAVMREQAEWLETGKVNIFEGGTGISGSAVEGLR